MGNSTIPDILLKHARTLWDQQNKYNKLFLEYITKETLELKNELWLDSEEQPLTPEQFQKRLSLNRITIYSNGDLEFVYDDVGNLFRGHWLLARGSLDEGPRGRVKLIG